MTAPPPSRISKFQHTAARRRLRQPQPHHGRLSARFNTQPPEGGCRSRRHPHRTAPVSTHSRPKAAACWRRVTSSPWPTFQHTAARRRLPAGRRNHNGRQTVSTHSRPKAAARSGGLARVLRSSFNTQPPEGGCPLHRHIRHRPAGFNTQPPEGGCNPPDRSECRRARFNTQPPEGGCLRQDVAALRALLVSTHSRPKAAAKTPCKMVFTRLGFNTQPPEGGCPGPGRHRCHAKLFQHTAARRRLRLRGHTGPLCSGVSTHSRPKAAADR